MSAPLDRAKLRENLATLEKLGDAIGGWTDKGEYRQTGYSLHIKFDNKVDVDTSMRHAAVMQRCPAMLAVAIRRLLDMTEPAS